MKELVGKRFSPGSGVDSLDNTKPWNEVQTIFNDNDVQMMLNREKDLNKKWTEVRNAWNEWSESAGGGSSGSSSGGGGGSDPSKSGSSGWDPRQTYRIDIATHFDKNWFQRKFKSGMLNKMIMGLKTMSMANLASNSKNDMKGHKYTGNEMLSQDERKLDRIQWNMTNKVAKDYITYFLGWSRKQEYYMDGSTPKAASTADLQVDAGVGKKFANKALSNRGILGRLRQKLFSGGQSNNVVSVAFQLADWRDGWKLVEEEKEKGGEEGSSGGDGGKEGGGSGRSDGSGGSGGKGDGSSGSEPTGASGDGSSGAVGLGEKDMDSLMTLLQRVRNVEKEVYGKQMDESTSKDNNVDGLVDEVLMAYIGENNG